jgi:hypothetical protein
VLDDAVHNLLLHSDSLFVFITMLVCVDDLLSGLIGSAARKITSSMFVHCTNTTGAQECVAAHSLVFVP